MKHVTYGAKSFLTGDVTADLLVRYAAALASAKLGDAVTVNMISADGHDGQAQLLLDTGAPLMV